MITVKLTNKQLEFLLYPIESKSYEKIVRLTEYIHRTCLKCNILWCEELFKFLNLELPEELKDYGWRNPINFYTNGYFCGYSSKDDSTWHFKTPIPDKINI